MSLDCFSRDSRRAAFSIIELTGVVVLCSLVAAMGLPRWIQHSERGRVTEAMDYLTHISQLQQNHFQQFGCYAADPMKLDLALVAPASFAVDVNSSSDEDALLANWSMSLVRQGSAFGYGDYRITFDESGFARQRSNVNETLLPPTDSTLPHSDIR